MLYLFDETGVQLITIPKILRNLDATSSLPTTSEKLPLLVVSYKPGLPLSPKMFSFIQFLNTLHLETFLSNLEIFTIIGYLMLKIIVNIL